MIISLNQQPIAHHEENSFVSNFLLYWMDDLYNSDRPEVIIMNTKFDRNIEKLRLGGPFKLEPCDCAYFVSLFERYDMTISFVVSVKDKIVTLRAGSNNITSHFLEKRMEAKDRYYFGNVNLNKEKR